MCRTLNTYLRFYFTVHEMTINVSDRKLFSPVKARAALEEDLKKEKTVAEALQGQRFPMLPYYSRTLHQGTQ